MRAVSDAWNRSRHATPAAPSPEPRWLSLFAPLLVVLYTLPATLPALRSYFTGDDLMNLDYHLFREPPSHAFLDTLLFWTPYRRPAGGILYIILFHFFGLRSALPYYATGIAIFLVNTIVVYFLVRRLTGSSIRSALAVGIASVHVEIMNIWYDFGAVYELLAFGFMMAAFHLYLNAVEAGSASARRMWLAASVALYIVAIGGKEMAVTLPAVLLLYELIYRFPSGNVARGLGQIAVRLVPYGVVGAGAALGKSLDPMSMARLYPDTYGLYFDRHIFDNITKYLWKLSYEHLPDVGNIVVLGLLALVLAIALWSHSRDAVFGLLYFLVTLTPVLPLPRNWGLFLYIPLVGLGIFVATVATAIGAGLLRTFRGERRPAPALAFGAVVVALLAVLPIHLRRIKAGAQVLFVPLGITEHHLVNTLFADAPADPQGTAFVIMNPPARWFMTFALRLHYLDPGVQVLENPRPVDVQNLVRSGFHPLVFRISGENATIGSPEVLTHATAGGQQAHPKAGGVLEAIPNPIRSCDGTMVGATTVQWHATHTTGCRIYVNSDHGPLFAAFRLNGSSTTGKWVQDGTRFIVVDDSGGQSELVVHVTTNGCR